jgi:hypothetical protein
VTRFSRLSVFLACTVAAIGIAWLSQQSPVQAQTGKSKSKTKAITPAELKKLDAKLEDVQRSFLKETDSIIKGYEEGGQYDRAKILLEVLLKLDPKNELIKKKLEHLDDQILDSTESDMDLDPSKGWQPVGTVVKDRLIRIEASGDYKFVASLPTGPDGFPTKDAINDMAGAPLGAVVAIIMPPAGVPSGGGGGGGGGGNQKQPNAFFVGSKFEQPAHRDGMLLLKVNVPPGSKCTGKLKVKVGGVTRST